MSRKDYIKIAAVLKEVGQDSHEYADWTPEKWYHQLVERFADMLAEDNSRFDYYKFKNATEGR